MKFQFHLNYKKIIKSQQIDFDLPISANSARSSSSPRNHDVTATYFLTCSGTKHRKKATFPKNTSFPSTLISYNCLTTEIKDK